MGPVAEIVNKAEYPNHVRSYDFLEDRTERGGKLRILVTMDEYTSECLAVGYVESFIDKLRAECLNREVFRNGKEAQINVEAWRQEYNIYRPHSSLGYMTPPESARQYCENEAGGAKRTQDYAGTVSL